MSFPVNMKNVFCFKKQHYKRQKIARLLAPVECLCLQSDLKHKADTSMWFVNMMHDEVHTMYSMWAESSSDRRCNIIVLGCSFAVRTPFHDGSLGHGCCVKCVKFGISNFGHLITNQFKTFYTGSI